MGNSTSTGRGHQQDTVDFGLLIPQGVYTGPRDWNQTVVTQLICERRLAPFYRPLEDYDESWDDEQILAARKESQETDASQAESSITRTETVSSSTSRTHHKRPSNLKEQARQPEAAVYRGAVECPICFLYYPPNINHSRCCDQAICTECFVQIKRADPTTTHLVSEPASCPYCVQENFGVVYTPPPWRAGIGSEGATPPSWPDSPRGGSSINPSSTAAMKRRRKSFTHDSPEVVTIDQIRPDWEQKLAAVRAAVARRANRRIIMRQVGDRLIPVGITSGRMHTLPVDDGQGENGEGGGVDRSSRRSRRRNQNPDINQLLGTMGLAGQDLEELMVMEAMRLSLIEHEEQQKKEREAEAKKNQGAGESSSDSPGQLEGVGSSSAVSPEIPGRDSSASAEQDDVANLGSSLVVGSSVHSSTLSLSRQLSAEQTGGSRIGRRGSPSPTPSQYSIRAALASAASTANAVLLPGRDEVPDDSLTKGDAVSRESDEQPQLTLSPPLQVVVTPELGATEPVPILEAPSLQQSDSFASSIAPDNNASYEILPSSPGSGASSLSQKPLLNYPITSVVSAGSANGDPSNI